MTSLPRSLYMSLNKSLFLLTGDGGGYYFLEPPNSLSVHIFCQCVHEERLQPKTRYPFLELRWYFVPDRSRKSCIEFHLPTLLTLLIVKLSLISTQVTKLTVLVQSDNSIGLRSISPMNGGVITIESTKGPNFKSSFGNRMVSILRRTG